MRILITGNTGFIGRSLTDKLGSMGYEIYIVEGDISEKDKLNRLNNYEIRHVFHLASKINIKESWEDPYEYYKINVLGTINVLEFAKRNKCGVTYMSSYVYGQPDYLPIDERHKIKSTNPYCQTKISSESLCNLYSLQYGINVAIFRAFSVYGEKQKTLLIPKLLNEIFSDSQEAIEVPNEKMKRDFLFIDDAISALVGSFEKKLFGVYNLGSGTSISVKEIIDMLFKITGITKPVLLKDSGLLNEIITITADMTKLKNDLSWTPKIDIRTGLSRCVQYYKYVNQL